MADTTRFLPVCLKLSQVIMRHVVISMKSMVQLAYNAKNKFPSIKIFSAAI